MGKNGSARYHASVKLCTGASGGMCLIYKLNFVHVATAEPEDAAGDQAAAADEEEEAEDRAVNLVAVFGDLGRNHHQNLVFVYVKVIKVCMRSYVLYPLQQ